jgi:hypothetical protein
VESAVAAKARRSWRAEERRVVNGRMKAGMLE